MTRTWARWLVAWPTPRIPPLSLSPTPPAGSPDRLAEHLRSLWRDARDALPGRGLHEVGARRDGRARQGADLVGLERTGFHDRLPGCSVGRGPGGRELASERIGLVEQEPSDGHVDLVRAGGDGFFDLAEPLPQRGVR
jgi:hypothetical protein